MNSTTIAALLLPLCCASLSAQRLELTIATGAHSLTASVARAHEGAFVLMVLGHERTQARLPDGQVLGVAPDMVVGFAVANGEGPTPLVVQLSRHANDMSFVAQAVAIDPRLPLDAPGCITLSAVQAVRLSAP